MRRISAYLAFSVLFFGVQASTKGQDILVPAGTLLRCTLDEPNFSSATADIGDPVVCHLSALRQFGKAVFPRGSYLGGHLEADKEPGHFVGKGYLKIEFDRIGFPDSDIPVPSKIIAAKGYRVDKKGDIVGKGHATRDTVEWLIPPLWPWKILMLPARGPRPTLKGESQITVRLMDDIDVPRSAGSLRSYERPPAPASYHSQSFRKPAKFENSETPATSAPSISEISYAGSNATATDAAITSDAAKSEAPAPLMARTSSVVTGQPARVRLIALKSENVYAVTNYRINGGSLRYVLASGGTGSVDLTEVDWRATSRLNAEPISATQNNGHIY
ncbi:MAG TPA: hypothetical protein VN943_15275 [Candidatus Acidoferrum sp.]|nr:hypothetical protein [Candidatus Acidoferrum sp.]